jgi:hypothetical protein
LDASAFNLRVLLHTEIGIPNILVFLKETSICIRKWHIKRNEEVVEAVVAEEVESEEESKEEREEESDWELWEETEEEVEIGEGE